MTGRQNEADVTYREPLLLFHNTGKGFEKCERRERPDFLQAYELPGLAMGDFNNDGAVDVLVAVNNDAPPRCCATTWERRTTGWVSGCRKESQH